MGEMRTLALTSTVTGQPLELSVALPGAYDPTQRYPVIYADPGPVHFHRLDLPAWLEGEREAGRLPACIAVHLPEPEGAPNYWIPGTADNATLAELIRQDVVPAVEAAFACGPRLLLAASSMAVATMEAAVRCPGLFERAALQSPGWLMRRDGELINQLDDALTVVEQAPHGPLPSIWFVWGDSETDEWEAASRPNGRRMMSALRARGAKVVYSLVPGGHGLELMRATLAEALSFLLS